MIERHEVFKYKVVVSSEKLKTKPELLRQVLQYAGREDLADGYTVTYEQQFDIEYCDVVGRLDILLGLMEIGSITNINTRELNHGKCLIQEALCKIEQIEGKYKND